MYVTAGRSQWISSFVAVAGGSRQKSLSLFSRKKKKKKKLKFICESQSYEL